MKTIPTYISEALYAKLVTVASKASGQDKPSQDQIDNTLALLAHHALVTAHAQVTTPEPVAKPIDITLPGRATLLRSPDHSPVPTSAFSLQPSALPKALLLFLLLALGLTSGCAVIRYQAPDGSRFTAWTCLADDKIAKLAIDKRTKATSTGLAIGAIDHAIDDDAVQAIVAGVVEGIVKGVK